MSYNQLRSIDLHVFEGVPNITELQLQNNQIDSLPENMGVLYKLKVLDVSNNNLTDIPATLGYPASLHRLLIDGNSLRSIRRSVTSSSVHVFKRYLRTRGDPPVGWDGAPIDRKYIETEGDEEDNRPFAMKAPDVSQMSSRITVRGGGERLMVYLGWLFSME